MSTYPRFPISRSLRGKRQIFPVAAALFILPTALSSPCARANATGETLRSLIVGGGPTPNKNQIAIESNVRYVTRLLPPDNATQTLFADGDLNSATVLFTPASTNTPANVILRELLGGERRGAGRGQRGGQAETRQNRPEAPPPPGNLTVPTIAKLDGPATSGAIETAFTALSGNAGSRHPYFLYFTGHGNLTQASRDKKDFENNHYALWNDQHFTVRDLSQQIARLPQNDPVVLVMVQCYSGSFANVIFENGDAKGDLLPRDIVGFFASTKDRLAAGCSPSINEEYYRDFTSYFFAALTGRDRLNRPFIVKADYNDDGKIGLDEAFYWSLINDESIDVPVATSDVFLERFVPLEGDAWQETPYQTLLQWASPAQRVALEELSQTLELQGEQRIRDAKNLDVNQLGSEARAPLEELNQRLRSTIEPKRRELLAAFPALSTRTHENFAREQGEALQLLEKEVAQGKWNEVSALLAERGKLSSAIVNSSAYTAKQLRFLRLAQKVVRDHTLRQSNDEALKQRYLKLLQSEARDNLFPYHNTQLTRLVARSF